MFAGRQCNGMRSTQEIAEELSQLRRKVQQSRWTYVAGTAARIAVKLDQVWMTFQGGRLEFVVMFVDIAKA